MFAVPSAPSPRTPRRAERLTPAELARLWNERPRTSHQLVTYYGYLVPKTRERTVPAVPAKIDPGDLEQEGALALIRAVNAYNPHRSVQFASYAISTIRGAMLEMLRKEDWVPRSVRTKQKLLERASQALAVETRGQRIAHEDKAAHLGLDIDAYYRLYADANALQVVSLEEHRGSGNEMEELDDLSREEALAAEGPDPFTEALQALRREMLGECIGWLPKAEQVVVRRYHYEGETLHRIADGIGRSESRAHQLHRQALDRLRLFLAPRAGLWEGEGAPPGVTCVSVQIATESTEPHEKPPLAPFPAQDTLPLTKRALCAFSRWQEAVSSAERRALREYAHLSAAEVSALGRLASNIRTLGEPAGWILCWRAQEREPRWRDGLAETIARGLVISSATGLARAVAETVPGLMPFQRRALESHLARHLPEAPRRRTPAPPEKSETPPAPPRPEPTRGASLRLRDLIDAGGLDLRQPFSRRAAAVLAERLCASVTNIETQVCYERKRRGIKAPCARAAGRK